MLRDLNQRDQVDDGIYRALESILRAAERQLDRDREDIAVLLLRAFIRIVEAQRGEHITTRAADQLIELAREVIRGIR